ncbi:hypothetical protein E8E14_013520 [Neopestalotiopsis sp. 37M]|nr:hypothetical protein E8E14_013520 [Neopestalotiopsis sp. 37M]
MDTADSDGSLKTSGSFNFFNFFDENEAEYLDLIQHQIQPFFPDFASALAKQSPLEREYGRCAVVDLSHESGERRTLFSSSDELRDYLSTSQPISGTDADGGPQRRLFILEDLSSNYISVLGSRLKIPPSFFAGHYNDPAVASGFNHRDPFERYTTSRFQLRYADCHRAEVDVSPNEASSIYAFNTNVFRYLHAYNPNGPLYDEMRSSHILSFWSSPPRTDGAWDAVLLVDPPLGSQARLLPSKKLVPVRRDLKDENSMPRHYLYPEINPSRQLPEDTSAWAATYQRPQFISMFDDTLNDFTSSRNRPVQELQDPRTAVEWPRKIVLAIVLKFLRRRYLNLLRLQNTQVKPDQIHRTNYLANFSAGALSRWHDQYFDFIVGSRAAMHEVSREVEENMISVGIAHIADDASRLAPQRQWEIDGWLSVMGLVRDLDKLLASLSTGYMQYITIQEARVSGANAQSLSKITVSTMLFIPLSTIAAIFSMSDDYLPGKPRAWVFWVVSLPFLLSLAYLYWRQQLLEVLAKKRLNLSHLLGKAKKSKDLSYV